MSTSTSSKSQNVHISQLVSWKKWVGTTAVALAAYAGYCPTAVSTTSANYHLNPIEILIDNNSLQITFEGQSENLQNKIIENKEDIQSTAISHADRLDEVKDSLGLSITQLAELLNVTRKSIYDWYDGSVEPRIQSINRIEAVINTLNSLSTIDKEVIDLKRLKVVWHIPVNGESFCSILNDDKLTVTALNEKLTTKLVELTPRMVKKTSSLKNTTIQVRDAHLAEFIRETDFG